jgi:hypothetical protein
MRRGPQPGIDRDATLDYLHARPDASSGVPRRERAPFLGRDAPTMIKKQYVKTRKVTKITFEHPADVDAEAIDLIADRHDWRPVAFDRLKSGRWKLVQELEPGAAMQFRYRVHRDGGVEYWDDRDADAFVPNDQGTENGVVAG